MEPKLVCSQCKAKVFCLYQDVKSVLGEYSSGQPVCEACWKDYNSKQSEPEKPIELHQMNNGQPVAVTEQPPTPQPLNPL